MKVKATYFQNDKNNPLCYGDVELINPKRQRLRGEEAKEGIVAESAFVGFCGNGQRISQYGSCREYVAQVPGRNKQAYKRPRGSSVDSF